MFFAANGWSFLRGASRGAVELLWASAGLTLAIPLSTLAGLWRIGGSWNHDGGWPVDLTALATIPVLLLIARHTRKRMQHGHADSVWAQAWAPLAPEVTAA